VIEEKVRVRFAPSPTGDLHIGNARTALFNWLFARQNGGDFILRIEDTDQTRTTNTFEMNLLNDLRWLGIGWDEGPDTEGAVGPYHQTERIGIYNYYLEKLIRAGKAYPCYCSEAELEAERASQVANHTMPRYKGACRNLTLEERKRREGKGIRPAYRFMVEDGLIEFEDTIRGSMKFAGTSIGDFIVIRSNGLPAYNFAVVVDDHLMNISHVIRGEDHLSNTATQILLYHAFGFYLPVFTHHSLILGKDRTKLSKRHGSVSVREFRNRGFLPEVLINYLALLGNSFGEGREVCDISEIINMFSLNNTGKSGAIFDEDKLMWLNSAYIKKYPSEKLLQSLMPFIKKAGYHIDNATDLYNIKSIVDAVHANIHTLAEIEDYLALFNDGKYLLSPEAMTLLGQDDYRQVVKSFHGILASEENSDDDFYESAIKKLQINTGKKGRALFLPIRYALTGSDSGPELDKIATILGKKSVMKRLEKALAA
jgi:nondiscriminating glutamyl-tRNA synthetase